MKHRIPAEPGLPFLCHNDLKLQLKRKQCAIDLLLSFESLKMSQDVATLWFVQLVRVVIWKDKNQ